MGLISGLISILLLVDLCTCRIYDQNQNYKMLHSRRFFVYIVKCQSTSFMAPLPGIRQLSLGSSVVNLFVYVLVSQQ